MENWLFFKRWLKQPSRLGTCLPISKRLAKAAVSCLSQNKDAPIIELGAGTGKLSQELVNAGFSNITLIELDPDLCSFLKERFKGVCTVIEGNAKNITHLLPDLIGQTETVISVIPLMYLDLSDRLEITEESFKMLSPQGRFLHVCYTPFSPLKGTYKASALFRSYLNVPPGFVWEFSNARCNHVAA